MNQAINNILAGSAFGLCSGIVIVLYHFVFVHDDFGSNYNLIPNDKFEVIHERVITSGEKLIVTGTVKNLSTQPAFPVRVTSDLYDEEGIFGNCFWTTLRVSPGESQPYSIICHNFNSEVGKLIVDVNPYILEAEVDENS